MISSLALLLGVVYWNLLVGVCGESPVGAVEDI